MAKKARLELSIIKKSAAVVTCTALALCCVGCAPTYKGKVSDVIEQCQTEKTAAHIEVTGYLSNYGQVTYHEGMNMVTFSLHPTETSLNESVYAFIEDGSQSMADELNNRPKNRAVTVSGTLLPELTNSNRIMIVDASVL